MLEDRPWEGQSIEAMAKSEGQKKKDGRGSGRERPPGIWRVYL